MQKKYDLSSLGARKASSNQNQSYDLSSLGGRRADQNKPSMDLTLTKSTYRPESSERTGWKGVGEDVLEAVNRIPDVIGAIPGQVHGIKGQYQNEPSRIGKNLLAGIGEAGIGLLNTPHDIIKYLGKKEITPEWLTKYNELPFTHIPEDLGIEKAMGLGQEHKGDALIKLIPALIGGYGIKKITDPRSLRLLQKELDASKKFVEETTQHHKTFLGEGQEHGARASQQLVDFIEGKVNPDTGRTEGGLRRQVGSQYEKLSEDMSKENVQINQTPDMKAIQKSLTKLGKGVSSGEREKLLKMMTNADSKLQTVNGADALTAYRELKRQKSKSYQSAYEPGVGPKEHEQWIKKAEELNSLEKRMKEMLEKQIGGKYLEQLKMIDKEYATKIAPLSENSMYQEMLKHGQTSKKIIKYLHGKTAGNQTLNAIVENDPELQRVIVGQQYASSPEKLAGKPEVIEKYKGISPIISKIIQEQEHAQHLGKNVIPELEESIKKTEKKREAKKNFRKGGIATATGLGSAYALEKALDRNWKDNLPLLAALKTLRK